MAVVAANYSEVLGMDSDLGGCLALLSLQIPSTGSQNTFCAFPIHPCLIDLVSCYANSISRHGN